MKKKISLFLISLIISITNFAVPVFALSDSRSVLEIAVVFVSTVCRYGGMLFSVFTIFLFITAIHNDSGVKLSTARKFFIISLALLIVSMSLTGLVDSAISVFNSIIRDVTSVYAH